MKASILLNEIKESIENFDTTRIEESLKREDLNPMSRQLSIHNLETCRDIKACEIREDMDFDVDDGEIESFKKELHNFFEGCSPESDNEFRRFIQDICFFKSFIAKKPLHPVGMDMRDNNTVHEVEENGKTVYYCDIRNSVRDDSKGYYTCNYCICKDTSEKCVD